MQLSLEYLIKEPKIKKEQNPLLLLLHGYGSNEADLFSLATELPLDYYIVAARAPYVLQYGSYAWYAINFDADENKFSDYEQAKNSCNLISTFIDELLQKYPIATDNITLLGFSQGAILSYGIALSYPQKIKNVIALSGYLNESLLKENYIQNDFSKLAVFASHGVADPVIPVAWARKISPFLKKTAIAHDYREYPIGHTITPEVFYDVKNWLENR